MQELVTRIQQDAVHVGGGIIKVDSFINHQVDSALMDAVGAAFADRFSHSAVSKVITAEVSGIAPALMTARTLGVPLIYARKHQSAAMTDSYYQTDVVSRTKGGTVTLRISKRYLKAQDRVLVIDDFLATGSTLDGLIDLIQQSGAILTGIGCVIEKVFFNIRSSILI